LKRFARQTGHCYNPLVLAEWRNGRRWGFKIPCP
jgi:hypothetical protein